MLTLCKKSGDSQSQRHGESQLIFGPSRVPQSKYLFLPGETSRSLTPNMEQNSGSHGVILSDCVLQEPEYPLVVESEQAEGWLNVGQKLGLKHAWLTQLLMRS